MNMKYAMKMSFVAVLGAMAQTTFGAGTPTP